MTLSRPTIDTSGYCTKKVLFKKIDFGTMHSFQAYSLEDYDDLIHIRDGLINAGIGARNHTVYKNTYVLDIFEGSSGVKTYIPLFELVTKYLSPSISDVDIKLLNRVSKILLIKISDIK